MLPSRSVCERSTGVVHFNFATTVSFGSAAMCLSLAALGGFLGRSAASRHFRYAAASGFTAGVYCLTNAMIAGDVGTGATVWAGRLGLLVACLHPAAWLLFLAAWDRRPLGRLQRILIGASAVAGFAALVPGWAVLDSTTERTVTWLGVTYHDPDVGPLGSPIMLLAYAEHITAAVVAIRMTRRNPRALGLGLTLGLYCFIALGDWMSAVHVLDLPYLVDSGLALAFFTIGGVIVKDAADSAEKSVALERARIALAERENLAALGQLAAVVAHEVRNPVAIIFGALAGLEQNARAGKRSAEEEAKLLEIVGEEADRLKQLVSRLLDAVRPFELQYSYCSASALIRATIAKVTAGAGLPASQVELVSAPAHEIECDEILLGQALANLVQNAVVAPGRRSPVCVRASIDSSDPVMLRIDVVDDGDGVAPDARARLFTPFFTTRATGTGLGLVLVRRIAGAHGGTVEFEAPAERGASFVLRVPLRAADAQPKRLLGTELQ